jgi:hypothetical protein
MSCIYPLPEYQYAFRYYFASFFEQHLHHNMMIGRKTLGRRRLSRMLVSGSNSAYDTKKIDRDALYWPSVILRSSCRPSIFALPIFVLSRKDMRYKKESQGMSLRSSFHRSLRSCASMSKKTREYKRLASYLNCALLLRQASIWIGYVFDSIASRISFCGAIVHCFLVVGYVDLFASFKRGRHFCASLLSQCLACGRDKTYGVGVREEKCRNEIESRHEHWVTTAGNTSHISRDTSTRGTSEPILFLTDYSPTTHMPADDELTHGPATHDSSAHLLLCRPLGKSNSQHKPRSYPLSESFVYISHDVHTKTAKHGDGSLGCGDNDMGSMSANEG